MRHLTRWALLVGALLAPAQPVTAQSASFRAPGLRDFVHEVLTKNAGYQAARSQLAAAAQQITPAGALPDPMLTLGMIAVPEPSFDFAREPMTQIPVMLQQHFPFPGKQGALTAVARADSAVSGETVGAVRANLAAAAARAYYDLAYARTALAVWARRAGLADEAVQVSQVRYQTGAAPQTDLLRAQLRRAELDEQRRDLDAALTAATARLDALRNGPGDSVPAPMLISPEGQSALQIQGDPILADSALLDQLAGHGPAMLTADAEVDRADRRARVFGLAARPDFTLSLQYGGRFAGREPFLTALVGISIPAWSGRKQGPAARGAAMEEDAARQRREELLARLTGELRSETAQITALRARIEQTSDAILPLADAASVSALQRYQVGTVAFTAVLDTQDEAFRAQLRLARLIADYATARAQLAALVGEEWYQ